MKRCRQDKIVLAAIGVLAVIQLVLFLVPLIWVVLQSINSYYNYLINPFKFPTRFVWKNYPVALKNMNINVYTEGRLINYNVWNMTFYSFIIAGTRTLMTALVNITLAYVVAMYSNWKICRLISAINIMVLILPIYGSTPAGLVLHQKLGTYDNLTYLLVGYTGMHFGQILYGGAYRGMPRAYKEAAYIDGAGHFTIMFRIYIPLILPLVFAQATMTFLGFWNDHVVNVVWLPSYPNLAYGSFIYQSNAAALGASIPELLAGMVILAIPSIIIWILAQKRVSEKMAVGGLKG